MKYIRTKDGRIIDCRFSKEEYERDYPNSKVSYEKWFELVFVKYSDYEILKQADTIEKLFDRYVLGGVDIIILNEDHTKYCFINSNGWFDITDVELRKGIYGGIWTDEGLIYKAKMNKKGEFELL